jgi:hypothetical protein
MGKRIVMGETSEFYKHNEEARKKRLEYQKRYNKRADQVAKRVELNRVNRQRGQYGDGDSRDMSHQRDGRIIEESARKNRGSKSNAPGDRRARGGKKK